MHEPSTHGDTHPPVPPEQPQRASEDRVPTNEGSGDHLHRGPGQLGVIFFLRSAVVPNSMINLLLSSFKM